MSEMEMGHRSPALPEPSATPEHSQTDVESYDSHQDQANGTTCSTQMDAGESQAMPNAVAPKEVRADDSGAAILRRTLASAETLHSTIYKEQGRTTQDSEDVLTIVRRNTAP